jgi:hypothetical protein
LGAPRVQLFQGERLKFPRSGIGRFSTCSRQGQGKLAFSYARPDFSYNVSQFGQFANVDIYCFHFGEESLPEFCQGFSGTGGGSY